MGEKLTDTCPAFPLKGNTSRIKSSGQWCFNYDANGNLVMRGTGGIWNDAAGGYQFDGQTGELYRYGYDLSNRLVSVERSKAGSAALTMVARYTYDIRDLRIKTVKPGATTYTQYNPSGDIVWSEKGGETVTYVQALGQTWAEMRTDSTGSKTFWHHTDHEGTTEAITDSTGTVVWDASYGAYGDILRSNGKLSFTPSYTGKELDSDSGLYYFNARWYDPELGRFITEDPARDGENWYGYCSQNPVRYIDPSGLVLETAWDVASLAMGIASFAGNVTTGNVGGAVIDAVGIVADAAAVATPFVPGGVGAAIKGVRALNKVDAVVNAVQAANKVDNLVDATRAVDQIDSAGDAVKALDNAGVAKAVEKVSKPWKVGDPVNANTSKGTYPSWSTVKSRFWKNEGVANPERYSPDDFARMKKGRAPVHEDYGVSKEIHHKEGRGGTDPHRPDNLQPVWPWEHAKIDLFRIYKGPKP